MDLVALLELVRECHPVNPPESIPMATPELWAMVILSVLVGE